MRARVLCVLGVLVLACGGEEGAAVGAQGREQATPSPISDADAERVFQILSLANVYNERCGLYFGAPSDPRYAGGERQCEELALYHVDWLRANGFPSVQLEHVRGREFWAGQAKVQEEMRRCEEVIEAGPGDRMEKLRKQNECDPLGRLPRDTNGVPTVRSAGLHAPK
jgi:hypothetical protein